MNDASTTTATFYQGGIPTTADILAEFRECKKLAGPPRPREKIVANRAGIDFIRRRLFPCDSTMDSPLRMAWGLRVEYRPEWDRLPYPAVLIENE